MEAVGKGQNVSLNEDYDLGTTIPVTNDVTVDLNGKDFDASDNETRPFDLYNGATLTINAEGSEIDCGKYGLVNVASNANVNVIINGGTIKANTDNGAFIKIRGGNGNVNITLNNVNYVDESKDSGYIMNANGFSGTMNLTINGGSYKAFTGFQTTGNVNIDGASIATDSYAIIVEQGTAEIKNCTISLGKETENGTTVPAAAVIVAYSATATVEACTVTGTAEYGMIVLNTGGTIIAKNNNISVNTKYALYNDLTEGSALIKVDGVEVVNKTK